MSATPGRGAGAFEVNLDNFTGPFDLLLSLIAKHELDLTEVALGVVTDDFIAHLRAQEVWDLEPASEFLVIGATLLDLKTLRLLPTPETEDAEDLALLEARDLLFARLLQYRAFKDVAHDLSVRHQAASASHPRSVTLEPHLAALLPELAWSIGPQALARIAAAALAPRRAPAVTLTHLHETQVSVVEEAARLSRRLRRRGSATFRELVADAQTTSVMVARFLALLDLYRRGAVGFDQLDPLGDLTIRWLGRAEVACDGGADAPRARRPDAPPIPSPGE